MFYFADGRAPQKFVVNKNIVYRTVPLHMSPIKSTGKEAPSSPYQEKADLNWNTIPNYKTVEVNQTANLGNRGDGFIVLNNGNNIRSTVDSTQPTTLLNPKAPLSSTNP